MQNHSLWLATLGQFNIVRFTQKFKKIVDIIEFWKLQVIDKKMSKTFMIIQIQFPGSSIFFFNKHPLNIKQCHSKPFGSTTIRPQK